MANATSNIRSERPRDVAIMVKRCMTVGRPVMITGSPLSCSN